jgi:WD40 repeat protein
MIPMLAIVLGGHCSHLWAGQKPRTVACVAFAHDGSLASGTIRGSELETRLTQPKLAVMTVRTSVGNARDCELAFSPDGRWLAAVIPNDRLNVLIFDRTTGTTRKQFSSEWHTLESHADTVPHVDSESKYLLPHLGGFLQDGSLVLWRYLPERGDSLYHASATALHLERWSLDGTQISDQYLARWGKDVAGQAPMTADHLSRLWFGEGQRLRAVSFNDDLTKMEDKGSLELPRDLHAIVDIPRRQRLLSVSGNLTNQKAVLMDYSGHVDSKIRLPFIPNPLIPFAVDRFDVAGLATSSDNEIAAIGRERVAWVFVDTDRDWGSQVVLLNLHPLHVLTTLRTGKGGIQALAVDHRSGLIRLVGFWNGRWHDMHSDDAHPDRWKEATMN